MSEDKAKQGWDRNDIRVRLDMRTLKAPMCISAPSQPMGKVQLGRLPSSQVFTGKPDVELRRSTWTPGPEGQPLDPSSGELVLAVARWLCWS